MRRALFHARRGIGVTTPNPSVGATIVTAEGVPVGDGVTGPAGQAHAEIHALEEAGAAARGATLYCTLEPCAHKGRTGPCTDRILAAGIRRVVAAMEDPNPLVRGRGFATLRAHGVEVSVGLEREAAERINRPFTTAVREQRPFVIMKCATSLDGRIAAAPGKRTPITSVQALRHAQYVRAQVDAVAVGSETILVDDPLLTVRDVFRERPLTRVIFDRRLRTPPTARIFSTLDSGPVLILTTGDGDALHRQRRRDLMQAGATLVGVDDPDIVTGLRALPPFDIQSVIIEGGAVMHAAAWDAGLVDGVHLYVGPMVLGAVGIPFLEGRSFATSALDDLRVTPLGPDVLFEGYVHRPN